VQIFDSVFCDIYSCSCDIRVKEEALAFKMVYNMCILSDFKDISGKFGN
jgi:hypothetical protein